MLGCCGQARQDWERASKRTRSARRAALTGACPAAGQQSIPACVAVVAGVALHLQGVLPYGIQALVPLGCPERIVKAGSAGLGGPQEARGVRASAARGLLRPRQAPVAAARSLRAGLEVWPLPAVHEDARRGYCMRTAIAECGLTHYAARQTALLHLLYLQVLKLGTTL